jgi:class 3 adenylate cyclase
MNDIDNRIKGEKRISAKAKAIIPNTVRLVFNFAIFYFVPNEIFIFKSLIFLLCAFSVLWLILEFFFVFNYTRFSILVFIPAFSDLVSNFILVYLTGSINSLFLAGPLCMLVVSLLFSPDSKQSVFLLFSSLLLYFSMLLGIYLQVIPYVNLLAYNNSLGIFTYIFCFIFFSTFLFGLFTSARAIGQANLELNKKLEQLNHLSEEEKNKSERLLLNILPFEIAQELKENGLVKPVLFENVSILFTDFKGFTSIAEKMTPNELIKTLDDSFSQFDKIVEKYNLEKLKTIGDSYMCAGGIPVKNNTHYLDVCFAALEFQALMNQIKEMNQLLNFDYWELRLGIHCGPVVAGVVGQTKFSYDIWGDAVNIASRMESSGTAGEINISESIYELIKSFFECEPRGKINAKNKGEINMYYLKRIRTEYSEDDFGFVPNQKFLEIYKSLNSN